jgi:hypothetical protein
MTIDDTAELHIPHVQYESWHVAGVAVDPSRRSVDAKAMQCGKSAAGVRATLRSRAPAPR